MAFHYYSKAFEGLLGLDSVIFKTVVAVESRMASRSVLFIYFSTIQGFQPRLAIPYFELQVKRHEHEEIVSFNHLSVAYFESYCFLKCRPTPVPGHALPHMVRLTALSRFRFSVGE